MDKRKNKYSEGTENRWEFLTWIIQLTYVQMDSSTLLKAKIPAYVPSWPRNSGFRYFPLYKHKFIFYLTHIFTVHNRFSWQFHVLCYIYIYIYIRDLQLPMETPRLTILLQLTGRWHHDWMRLALRLVKSIHVNFRNQIHYFSIK